jgi:hypothetical protein
MAMKGTCQAAGSGFPLDTSGCHRWVWWRILPTFDGAVEILDVEEKPSA